MQTQLLDLEYEKIWSNVDSPKLFRLDSRNLFPIGGLPFCVVVCGGNFKHFSYSFTVASYTVSYLF